MGEAYFYALTNIRIRKVGNQFNEISWMNSKAN